VAQRALNRGENIQIVNGAATRRREGEEDEEKKRERKRKRGWCPILHRNHANLPDATS
jgi:hypothetical protein